MTTALFVETSGTVNNSPIQDYFYPDNHTPLTHEMTPGFKSVTIYNEASVENAKCVTL